MYPFMYADYKSTNINIRLPVWPSVTVRQHQPLRSSTTTTQRHNDNNNHQNGHHLIPTPQTVTRRFKSLRKWRWQQQGSMGSRRDEPGVFFLYNFFLTLLTFIFTLFRPSRRVTTGHDTHTHLDGSPHCHHIADIAPNGNERVSRCICVSSSWYFFFFFLILFLY